MRGEAGIEWQKKTEDERLRQYAKDVRAVADREIDMKKPSPNRLMAEEANDFLDSFPFWCEDCREDFNASCHKEWHRLYGDHVAIYRTEHECGTECIRYITHKDHDPYYQFSERIASDRDEYSTDILQAEQFGYRLNYGEPFGEFDKKREKKEEKRIAKEREKGFKLSK